MKAPAWKHQEPTTDHLLRVMLDVATAIAERKRLERGERRRRLAVVEDPPR